ncbi:Golgi transport protein Sly [Pyrenophora teres f. maculata]|nr:Golgi transport protein Sly [Pyrenophora teres f. maculata]
MSPPSSLRDRQIAAIKRILHLNAPITNPDAQDDANPVADTAEIQWKVLVVDSEARDVISTVLRVNDLRAAGVTVHFNIKAKRHPIPDTPAIYLISPTSENINLVAKDLQEAMYQPVYINFLSSIPRALLEDFGGQVAASGAEHIAQIYDQFLNFSTPNSDLFSLNIPSAYRIINSANTPDQELDELIDRIVSGLFSVVVTMAVAPIIRCPKGGAAELIAAKLDRKLRDYILNSKESFSSAASSPRPVLIILDRSIDLCALLGHSWIYQSLVADCLPFHLNTVTLTVPLDKEDPSKGVKKNTIDLTATDYFWSRNAALPFPEAAEDVTNEWQMYQQDAEKLTRNTPSKSIDDLAEANFASHLKGAIAQLPALQEKKRVLEGHMAILESLLDGIRNRKLDEWFQREADLAKETPESVLQIIRGEGGNDPTDKLRFFIQFYLTTAQELTRSQLESFDSALKAAGADTSALAYVASVRSISKMTTMAAPTKPAQAPVTNLFGGLSNLSSRLKDAGGFSANLDISGVLSGIKQFIPSNSDLPVTKIVEAICDPSSATSAQSAMTENYLYFDPRSSNARGTLPPASQSRNQQQQSRGLEATFGQKRAAFTEAICFTVGGGSMVEQSNLSSWASRTSAAGAGPRRVVYGSTELYSANKFIEEELNPLGKEMT